MNDSQMSIPLTQKVDGEYDFDLIAGVLLQAAQDESPGRPLQMWCCLEGEVARVRIRFDGQGGIQYSHGAMSTRFGASLYMALERQARSMVKVCVMGLEESRAFEDLP
jgi:hypothetical protein